MGNETSSEVRHDRMKRGGVGLIRSNSLRTNRPQFTSNVSSSTGTTTNQRCEEDTNTETKPGLIRSNTFTGFSRPIFRHANYKLREDNSFNERNEVTIECKNTAIDNYKQTDAIKTSVKIDHLDVKTSLNESTPEEQVTEDELFVPKKQAIISRSTNVTPTQTETTNIHLSTNAQISIHIKESSEEEENHTPVSLESKETTTRSVQSKKIRVRSSSFDSKALRRKNSEDEQRLRSKSDIKGEMILHQSKDELCESLFNSPDGSRKTTKTLLNVVLKPKNTIALRKDNCDASNSPEQGFTSKPVLPKTDDDIPSVATTTAAYRRGRRISDSYLLKEQHIKRSAQFTEMLKQLQRQRSDPLNKLSNYALGIITEKDETDQKRSKFQLHRHNDYLNSWLQDQSDRINILSAAVNGDPEKVRKLRASFRERPLKAPEKGLLPRRPNSVKLPRRKGNSLQEQHLISSSESENDDKNLIDRKRLDQNGNIKNPLKKQLSDTLLLVDNSFKNLKFEHPRREGIKFANNTSSSFGNGANNVAVVKPMVFSTTQSTAKRNEEKTVIVNTVLRANYHVIPEKLIYTDPVDSYTDKAKIIEEEKQALRYKGLDDKKLYTLQKQSTIDDELTEKQSFVTVTEIPGDVHLKTDTENTNIQENLEQREKTSKDIEMNSNVTEVTRNQTAEATRSMNRITESLSKIMGDLKDLRKQDIKLARQLIGLGKSIKSFKHERKSTNLEKVTDDENSDDV